MLIQHLVPWIRSEKPYHWRRLFGEPIELYRCKADGTLLTDRLIKKGICAGHQISQPALPDLFELIFIWLRIIT